MTTETESPRERLNRIKKQAMWQNAHFANTGMLLDISLDDFRFLVDSLDILLVHWEEEEV